MRDSDDALRLMISVQEKIKREEEIIKIMAVFPATRYKANPTPGQVEQLVDRAEAMGVTVEGVCNYFAFGINNFAKFDALIKELAVGWRPAGEVVEAGEAAQPAGVDALIEQVEMSRRKCEQEMLPPPEFIANRKTIDLIGCELAKRTPIQRFPALTLEPLPGIGTPAWLSLFGITISIDETVPDGELRQVRPKRKEWLFGPLLMDDETVRRLGGIIPEEDE